MSKQGHAVGAVRVGGDPGHKIARNTKLVRKSDGAEYVVIADAVVGADELALVQVAAVAPGEASNLMPGAVIHFKSAVDGRDDEAEADPKGVIVANATTTPPADPAGAPPTPPPANAATEAPAPAKARLHIWLNGPGASVVPCELTGPKSVRARLPGGGELQLDDLPDWDDVAPVFPSIERPRAAPVAPETPPK